MSDANHAVITAWSVTSSAVAGGPFVGVVDCFLVLLMFAVNLSNNSKQLAKWSRSAAEDSWSNIRCLRSLVIYKSVRSWIVGIRIHRPGSNRKEVIAPLYASQLHYPIGDHCSVAQIGQMSRRKRRDWKRLADSLAQVASVLKPREVQDRRPHPVHRSTSPSKIPKYNHIKHKDRNDRPLELPSRRENPNRRVQ
jgi:hypothetical protein